MSIKDDLIKYFAQFQDNTGGYGMNPQVQPNTPNPLAPQDQTVNKFGQLNPNITPMGTGGVNQLNTMTDSMSNPIDATKSLAAVAQNPTPNSPASDMGKQLIAKSMSSMGTGRQMAQPPLQMINAQQAFAQLPDATQPQQVQEFQPQQMAMMLRKKHGSY
jgi:hypothetical protein